MASLMLHCPFCDRDLANDNGAEAHFRVCSNTIRNDLFSLLAEDFSNDDLIAYNKAIDHLVDAGLDASKKQKRMIVRITRMWRANELLGRGDYHNQLVNELPSFEQWEEDETSIASSTQHIALLSPLLSASNDNIRTVLAIEDELVSEDPEDPQHDGKYTVRDDNTASPQHLRKFSEEKIDVLRSELNNPVSIFDIAMRFNERFAPTSTHPLAISKAILKMQIEASGSLGVDALDPHWNVEQDDVLLRLCATGMPMVEVARRFNAEVAGLNHPVAARSQPAVEAKVDDLLAYSDSSMINEGS